MENEFRTSDLYLASALVAEAFPLKNLLPDPRARRKLFLFDDSPGLRKTMSDFTTGTMVVNLRSYLNAWRELRRQIDY